MQSANFDPLLTCDDVLKYQGALEEFEETIQFCIDKKDWEGLTFVLDSRQKYLEKLSDISLPEHLRESFKAFLLRIVTKNEIFQEIISKQKNILFQQRLALSQRQRAIDEYVKK